MADVPQQEPISSCSEEEGESWSSSDEIEDEEEHQPSLLKLTLVLLGLAAALTLCAVFGAFGYMRFGLIAEDINEVPRMREVSQMVKISQATGGREAPFKMHLYCTGKHQRNDELGLTIVLDSMIGTTHNEWALIQYELSKKARVCSYDRAGLGYSEESSGKRTAITMAQELHQLLSNSAESAPFLMVGHSLGALVARAYATLHPEEVKGLVMIDILDNNVFSINDGIFANFWHNRVMNLYPYYLSSNWWVPRIMFELGFLEIPGYSSEFYPRFIFEQEKHFLNLGKHWRAIYQEHAHMLQGVQDYHELFEREGFDQSIIVRLITSLYYERDSGMDAVNEAWRAAHTGVGKMHSNGIRIIMDPVLHQHLFPFYSPQDVVTEVLQIHMGVVQPSKYKIPDRPKNDPHPGMSEAEAAEHKLVRFDFDEEQEDEDEEYEEEWEEIEEGDGHLYEEEEYIEYYEDEGDIF